MVDQGRFTMKLVGNNQPLLRAISGLRNRRFSVSQAAGSSAMKATENQVQLEPAQSALAHRIGLQSLDPVHLTRALSHPALSTGNNDYFTDFKTTGERVLNYFVDEYIQLRFPKLPKDSRTLARAVYTDPKNLAKMAQGFGLEYALVAFEGLPKVTMPPLNQYLQKINKERKGKEEHKPSEVLSEVFISLIGLIAQNDLLSARKFIDAFLFTGVFDTSKLVKPRYPIVQLTQALRSRNLPDPVFRLLHESGRTSSSSMYVVGVYVGQESTEMLAEGYGPSMNLAEHRAATEALRDMYLVDVHEPSRPSDELMDNPNVLTLDKIMQSSDN